MNMLRVLLGVQMSKLQVRVNSCLQWANDRVSKTVGAKNRELSCGWLVCYIHSPFLACCQCIAGTHLLKERIWANSGTSKKKNIISGPTPPTNTSCCVALPLKCSAWLPSAPKSFWVLQCDHVNRQALPCGRGQNGRRNISLPCWRRLQSNWLTRLIFISTELILFTFPFYSSPTPFFLVLPLLFPCPSSTSLLSTHPHPLWSAASITRQPSLNDVTLYVRWEPHPMVGQGHSANKFQQKGFIMILRGFFNQLFF